MLINISTVLNILIQPWATANPEKFAMFATIFFKFSLEVPVNTEIVCHIACYFEIKKIVC